MTDIVERLRESTQAMASSCSAPMELWSEHSNAALSAAIEIERLRAIALDMQTAYVEAADRAEEAVKAANALHDEIESLRLSLSEARIAGRREGMEAMTDALNDDALTKRAADFLLERDQQTTQDDRDDGECETSAFIILQMGAAAIRAAMEKEE